MDGLHFQAQRAGELLTLDLHDPTTEITPCMQVEQ
jgi:hypothetical protein